MRMSAEEGVGRGGASAERFVDRWECRQRVVEGISARRVSIVDVEACTVLNFVEDISRGERRYGVEES